MQLHRVMGAMRFPEGEETPGSAREKGRTNPCPTDQPPQMHMIGTPEGTPERQKDSSSRESSSPGSAGWHNVHTRDAIISQLQLPGLAATPFQ